MDVVSGGHNWSGVAAAAAFSVALLIELDLEKSDARKTWLHARMLAETVKSLAWCYAVAVPSFAAVGWLGPASGGVGGRGV